MEKKKILFVFTAAVLSLMVGCSKGGTKPSSEKPSVTSSTEATSQTTSQTTTTVATTETATTEVTTSQDVTSNTEATSNVASTETTTEVTSNSTETLVKSNYGTAEAPISVADAIAAMKNPAYEKFDKMYVTGVVKSVDFNSKFSSYSIYLEAGEETFQIYSAVLASGLEVPAVGGTIKVEGLTQIFVKDGATIYEVAYDNTNKISPSIYSVVNPHVHAYGNEYTFTTEPSLEAPGKATHACAEDGDTEEVDVPALTDTTVWTKTTSVAATHAQTGVDVYTSIYGSVNVTTAKLTAHTYGDWTISEEPTLEAGGKATHSCTVDSEVETIDIPALTDTSVWTVTTVPATYDEAGSTTYTSIYGSVVKSIAKLERSFSDWEILKMPTDSATGRAIRYSNDDDYEEIVVLPFLGDPAYENAIKRPTATETGYKGYSIEVENAPSIVIKTSTLYLITPDSNYDFVTLSDKGGDYTFEALGGNGFTSNNSGVGSSTANLDIYINVPGTLTFDYEGGSETNWDKFTVYAQGVENRTAIVNAISGENKSGSLTVQLKSCIGATSESDLNKIEFIYAKDGSGDKNGDAYTVKNIILETTCEPGEATLTYNTNGGSEIASATVSKYSPVTLPTAPTKEGMVFDGWYNDEELQDSFKAFGGIDQNKTIYAKWVAAIYVTVDLDNGEEPVTVPFKPGDRFVLPTTQPTKEGYYFAGWKYNDEIKSVAVFPNETSTIYATWRLPTTLTFDTKGGSEIATISQDVNSDFAKPADPVKTGFRFDGWYSDSECTQAVSWSSNKVTLQESATYYAKWVAQFNVTYKTMDGNVIKTVLVDAPDFEPSLDKGDVEGQVLGFYVNPEKDAEFTSTELIADTDIYVEIGSLVDALAPAGVLSSAVNGDADRKINSSTKVVKEFDVSKTEDGVKLKSTNEAVGYSESVISLTFAETQIVTINYAAGGETNYDYLNIYKVSDGTREDIVRNVGVTDKLTLGSASVKLTSGEILVISYRKDSGGDKKYDYVEVELSYEDAVDASIVYVYNDDATENTSTTAEMLSTFETLLTEPTNVRGDSYKFAGWYKDEQLTQPVVATDVVNASSITLYAKWQPKLTFTFISDGETLGTVDQYAENSVTYADPTKVDHVFRGWWTSEDDGETLLEKVDLSKGFKASTTFYAKWEETPAGATMQRPIVLEFDENNNISIDANTSETFQDLYVKFTLDEEQDIYMSDGKITKEGGTVPYNSTAKFWIINEEGTKVYSDTSIESYSAYKKKLGAGTYYIVFDIGGGSSVGYTGWGNIKFNIAFYEQDSATEAVELTKDETITFAPGSYASSAEHKVYTFTATADETIAVKLTNNGATSSYIKVYDSEAMSTVYKQVTNSKNNGTIIDSFSAENGKTYYIEVYTNYTKADLAAKEFSFVLTNYADGYAYESAVDYTIGSEISPEYAEGQYAYFTFTLTESDAFKLTVGATASDSSTKEVYIYNASDKSQVYKATGSKTYSKNDISLAAGTYVMKVGYSSTTYDEPFEVKLESLPAGEIKAKPIVVTLGEQNAPIAEFATELVASQKVYYSFPAFEEDTCISFDTNGKAYIKVYDGNTSVTDSKTPTFVAKAGKTYVLELYNLGAASDIVVTYSIDEEFEASIYAGNYLGYECWSSDRSGNLGTTYATFVNDFGVGTSGKLNLYTITSVEGTQATFTKTDGSVKHGSIIEAEDGRMFIFTNYAAPNDKYVDTDMAFMVRLENGETGSYNQKTITGSGFDVTVEIGTNKYIVHLNYTNQTVSVEIVNPAPVVQDATVEGTYTGSFMRATNQTIVLEQGGTGTFNGTPITYTVSDNVVSFSSGDYDFTLTFDPANGTLNGNVEYDYDPYEANFTKNA